MSEVEALRDENSRLRDALAKIERLTQLRITEREHEANRTAVSALKLAVPATEESSVARADHIVDVNNMVPADPSTPACVWVHSDTKTTSSCLRDGVTAWMWKGRFQDKCPNCLKPIKFAEAKL